MARKAFISGATKRISHPDDTENPTIYTIQAIPYRVTNWVRDNSFVAVPGVGVQFHAGRSASLSLQVGLQAVENLLGPDGEPVKIESTVIALNGGGKHVCVAESALDLLPPGDATWLTLEIQKFSGVVEDEVKKSGAPS